MRTAAPASRRDILIFGIVIFLVGNRATRTERRGRHTRAGSPSGPRAVIRAGTRTVSPRGPSPGAPALVTAPAGDDRRPARPDVVAAPGVLAAPGALAC